MKLDMETLFNHIELGTQSIEGQDALEVLIKHFDYSIKNIKSYDELTSEEKEIIPKKFFDMYVLNFINQ